jgi:putative transposase
LWVRPEDAVFFITICCQPKGQNQLCNHEIAAGIFESVTFRHERGDWWMDVLLLMPDHLHMLASFPSEKAMTTTIGQWKEFTAKRLGIEWQRDYFDHRLRREESVREKTDYILNNPVRRGLVASAEAWPFVWMPSNDGGQPGGLPLPTTALPTTTLLVGRDRRARQVVTSTRGRTAGPSLPRT